MESIGAEVGQKMRSAIKAKLMELDCYVDDELPDYIMVMVANRRTKSQMNEDLNLFLSTKTSTFVTWLHIVLKKLKEVTVTNPDVYKKAAKRKSNLSDDKPAIKLKKEKRDKKVKKERNSNEQPENSLSNTERSLTDDLPITANRLSEKRKIVLISDNQNPNEDITEDNFDIPLLSEVNESNEKELEDIERKIRSVKSRLGILVETNEENEDSINLKSEKDDFLKHVEEETNSLNDSRQISILENEISESQNKESEKPSSTTLLDRNISNGSDDGDTGTKSNEEVRFQHKRITYEENNAVSLLRNSNWRSPVKKISVLDRLGKRSESPSDRESQQKKMSFSGYRQEEETFLRYHNENKSTDNKDRDRTSRYARSFSDGRRDDSRDRRKNRSRSRDRSPFRMRDRSRNREREHKTEGILGRLGVMSKVSVPHKPVASPQEEEEETVIREVPSSIKVKPRVIPSDVQQPNKNLLLKAVAEAQRSIAQAPKVGNNAKPDALYTKKYKEKLPEDKDRPPQRKLPEKEKNKLKNLIQQSASAKMNNRFQDSDDYDSEGEYIPKPVRKIDREVPKYIPSVKSDTDIDEGEEKIKNGKQQFIITLDGVEKAQFGEKKVPAKVRLEGRKTPSPIVFDRILPAVTSTKPNIPDKLPIVHPPLSVKNKERCKYWPSCRHGDKCEFVHPSQSCEVFPNCKYGNKCLYLHPKCKFGASCTKRDCPYDHHITKAPITSKISSSCKFFPNCTNLKCPFYHPKACKYGKYCKIMAECTFSHTFSATKRSLSWRSN